MYLVQPLLFPYSAFQILFGGFLVVLNFSFRKCIVNFSTDYHTQLHILIVNDMKFILPWTHSNYVNAFLLFFHSNFSILFLKLRINNVLNVLANNLSTRRYFFFFFYKNVACDHAGNDKAESALPKFISLLCKSIYIPWTLKTRTFCIV